MTALQIKRNQKVIRALKANKKKAKEQMRRLNGNRCCLCVAEDTAIADGLKIEKCQVSPLALVPKCQTRDYLGWDGTDPHLILLKGHTRYASSINDSELNIPHKIIAEYFANTFTRKRIRLSKEARKYAEKLIAHQKLTNFL